jgi:hypothetical protein
VVILVVAAVSVIVALIVMASRRRVSVRSSVEPRTSKAVTSEAKHFCVICGAELPASSKFCNKCGTAHS